jgi:hypothetical protein
VVPDLERVVARHHQRARRVDHTAAAGVAQLERARREQPQRRAHGVLVARPHRIAAIALRPEHRDLATVDGARDTKLRHAAIIAAGATRRKQDLTGDPCARAAAQT